MSYYKCGICGREYYLGGNATSAICETCNDRFEREREKRELDYEEETRRIQEEREQEAIEREREHQENRRRNRRD